MIQNGAAGLLWDPGLGKTRATLEASNILKLKKFIKGVLIIAPLRVIYDVWPDEIKKWNSPLSYKILHGKDKDTALTESADIYLINPEGLPWLRDSIRGRVTPFNMLVVDESSKFKTSSTKRFKILKKMLSSFKRRYILTGSPAPNGLIDLWSQAFILDGGVALGKFMSHYRAEYFIPSGYEGYVWALADGAEKKIYKKLKPLVMRLDAEDYLKLPPLMYVNRFIELTEKAREFYDTLESDLIAEFDENTITAANVAVVTNKLRQVTGGAIYLDDADTLYKSDFTIRKADRKYGVIHEAKIEALSDLIEELEGQPTIVAYEFKHELKRLQAQFPTAPFIAGGVTPQASSKIKEDWNAGKVPLLICQPQTMSHGLNLQGAGRAIVWFTATWNLEDYEQLIRRVWRQGKTEPVFVYHLLMKRTVDDQVVMPALRRKAKTQNELLDALKSPSKKLLRSNIKDSNALLDAFKARIREVRKR